ncbi:bifunctional folylpolyglutamate synthase/dihydrofolate synthase [Humidisolicoccus flavus]|uniref:bifunctional folylpolyglutamate synthase/dihydrofolate synthase n=1 Tax=Humidisolicoccus flavus TaxID=3111414 RepID=UPI003D30042F
MERAGEQAPEPRLTATARAAELLGDPQRAFRIVHVTGTNGKTSTSRMIESLLRAHGLRTGLMTSPHLERVNERILIDGDPVSDEAFARNWSEIQPFLELVDKELTESGEQRLTFFEAFTVLAFTIFADAPADVVVLEVGMGGEWDSTNVADGDVAVLTPIDLDHVERLGRTISEIARTKSGIIKPGAIVVSSAQPEDALAEITAKAAAVDATVKVAGTDFSVPSRAVAVGGQMVTIAGLAAEYSELFVPLLGAHQAENAAVAVAAVESFLGGGSVPIDGIVIAEGLAAATSPGRLQLLAADPPILVDAAHNPHGARALAKALGEFFNFSHITLVFGVLDGKDVSGILDALAPVVDDIVVTQTASDRALDVDALAAQVVAQVGAERVTIEDSAQAALEYARDNAEEHEGAVLVAGSIVLAGEIITIVREQGWGR